MKLARATLFVVCTNEIDRVGRSYRQPKLPAPARPPRVRKPARLVARWQVSPLTQRLECSWSLEALAFDGPLCRSDRQRWRLLSDLCGLWPLGEQILPPLLGARVP
jgi:hypothetical protein